MEMRFVIKFDIRISEIKITRILAESGIIGVLPTY